ncbi:MAG: aldo/keto reductase [Planctomycetota bacterium]|jgi:aryl-alcohol dehydrogenase-like predicted oxidoreductase
MDFSKIMLGTVQFGVDYGIANTGGKPSYKTARDIIARAYEGGVNTLDTAAAYGDSEEVLGRALTELKIKDKMQVISKVPPVSEQELPPSEAEKFIIENVEKSLKNLQTGQITAMLFHNERDFKYIDVLKKLEDKGLIGGAGVSLDTAEYCNQVFDKRFDNFLKKAEENKVNIFTRSLYLQGLLLMPEEKIEPDLSEVIPVRQELQKLAEDAGISMIELCFRFVLSNSAITSILTGVDNTEQLDQNLALLETGPLSAELFSKAAQAVPHFSEKIIRPKNWKSSIKFQKK